MSTSEIIREESVKGIKNSKSADELRESLNNYLSELMQDAHTTWFKNDFHDDKEKAYCLGAMRSYSLISAILNGRLEEYENYLKNPPEEFDGRIERLWDDENVFNWKTIISSENA